MLISLPPQLEKFVQKKVQSGEYDSEGEVLCEALELLAEREAADAVKLEWLRAAYQQGIESLEKDGGIPAEQVFAELDEITEKY